MEMTWAILKMILVLGTILLALFFLARLMKKSKVAVDGASGHSGIRILATQCLAPQKYVSLIEMGGEVLALGISESQITFLTKIENREFIERISQASASKQEGTFPFHYVQSIFTKPKGMNSGWLRRVYGK